MKLKLRHIIAQLVVQGVIALCTTFLCFGQIKIPNPSFEDTVYFNFSSISYCFAKDWKICSYTPDLIWQIPNNHPPSSNGSYYVNLASEFDYPVKEAMSVKLPCALKTGVKYKFNVDLRMFEINNNQEYSGTLYFYGSSQSCNHDSLLWQSPELKDTTKWATYCIKFTAHEEISYLYFTSGSFQDHGAMTGGAVLIDNLSNISIDSGYTAIKIQTTANTIVNGECVTLNNNYLIGNQTEYKLQWLQNGIVIDNGYSLNVCPNTTTTYYVKAIDSCGYYGSDSITITVTPSNKAFYNSTTGKLQLQYSLSENATFKIYNMLGQIENELTLSKSRYQSEIDVRGLTPGIYIACIQNDLGKIIWRQKIFINNL